MRKHQQEGLQQFIDQLNLVSLRPFSKKEIEDMRKEYRQRVINKTRKAVRARAESDAIRMVNQLSVDDLVTAIQRTQQLIGIEYQIPSSNRN